MINDTCVEMYLNSYYCASQFHVAVGPGSRGRSSISVMTPRLQQSRNDSIVAIC